MTKFRTHIATAVAAVVALVAVYPASAGVTVTIEEIGNDVYMSGGGTLDASSWTPIGPGILFVGRILPNQGVSLGPGGDDFNSDWFIEPTNFQGPDSIGPGLEMVVADFGSGDPLALVWDLDGGSFLVAPLDYTFGDPIEGDATFLNQSFASIGLTPGEYTWTWDTADGNGDFFTIIVVPAPGAFALIGLAAIAARSRRRDA